MSFPEKIFKAYDIRGLVGSELTAELAYKIGRGFAQFMKQNGAGLQGQSLEVGRDMRPTSVEYAEEVIKAIRDEGINVVDIGLVSTPLFNFACAHYPEHTGGIMVTASHNPGSYNGFKMTLRDGMPIGMGSGMPEIRDLSERATTNVTETRGMFSQKEVLPDYLNKVFSVVDVSAIKPLKIVIDAGNGMANATFPKLIQNLPIKVEFLYLNPDGNFPNHEANPLKLETLRELQKKVVENHADFGFALDGDADRIGLVDEKGEVVDASFVATLIGEEVLKKHPGATMFYDLRSSMIVKEVWEKMGAKTEKCMVGHALIKKMIKEKKASFASELSLHLYFSDMYGVECSDLSFLYILQLLSRESKSLSELSKPLKKYYHSGETNFDVQDKEGIMKKIEEQYRKNATEISHLDGVWMSFGWGWFNVRASNTEPVLRLNLEAKDKETMEKMFVEVVGLIKLAK